MRLIGTVSAVLACIAMAAVGCRAPGDNDQVNTSRPGRTNMQPTGTSRPGVTNARVDGGAYGPSSQRSPATQGAADSVQFWDGGGSSGAPASEYESPPGGIESSPGSAGSSSAGDH